MATRYESLSAPGVDALFAGFRATAFRLETLQRYSVPSEAEPFRRFLAGEAPRDFSWIDGWWKELRAGIAAGKSYSRVHVVVEPLSDYMRFLFAWVYRRSVGIGEDIRILPMAPGEGWPAGIPRTDFWLFDAAQLLQLTYDDEGRFVHAELVGEDDDEGVVGDAVRVRDRAWRLAVPFDEYVAGLDDLMRPAARPGPATAVQNVVDGGTHGVTIQVGTVHGDVRLDGPPPGGVTPPAPPRLLPAPVGRFVNRESQLALLDASSDADPATGSPQVVHVICGGPGTGKTALVVRWAHTGDRFPDGQLYIDMRGYGPGHPLAPGEALDLFLRALHVPPDDIPRELDGRVSMYRSVLAGKRALVVIDNVASVDQVRPLLPGAPTCRVVATSRSTLSGLVAREGATRMIIGELSVEDSLALLREIAGVAKVDADVVAAEQVVALCGRLPLALRVVAERASLGLDPDLAPTVEALQDEQERLDALDDPDDELSSVRAVFAYSYRRLHGEQARVFRLLGLHPGPAIPLTAVAALTGLDRRSARRAVEDLVRVSLVEAVAPERYRLHDLLRLYAAERAREDEDRGARQAALRRLGLWYVRSVDAAQRTVLPSIGTPDPPGRPLDLPDVPVFASVDAAMRWFEAEKQNLVELLQALVAAGQHDLAWRLPMAMYALFELRNHWEQWPDIHRLGIEAATAAGDEVGLAFNHLGLADAQWVLQDTDAALASYRRCAELAERTGTDWVLGFAYRQIGTLLAQRGEGGDDGEAGALYHRALDVFARSGERRGEAMTLLSLAGRERRSGDIDAAVALCVRALEAVREAGDRWTVAWVELSLGENLLASGAVSDALERFRHAAETFAEFGDEIAEAEALLGVAEALQALGRGGDLAPPLQRIDDILDRRTGSSVAHLTERRAALPRR